MFLYKFRLNRLKITHVLSVVFIPPAKNLIPPHIKHLFLKADDNVAFNMTPYFEQACQFIEEARQANSCVLVHCACGVSRSTTIYELIDKLTQYWQLNNHAQTVC